jgi:hypothetical protein
VRHEGFVDGMDGSETVIPGDGVESTIEWDAVVFEQHRRQGVALVKAGDKVVVDIVCFTQDGRNQLTEDIRFILVHAGECEMKAARRTTRLR